MCFSLVIKRIEGSSSAPSGAKVSELSDSEAQETCENQEEYIDEQIPEEDRKRFSCTFKDSSCEATIFDKNLAWCTSVSFSGQKQTLRMGSILKSSCQNATLY